jgi:hypothetical protein
VTWYDVYSVEHDRGNLLLVTGLHVINGYWNMEHKNGRFLVPGSSTNTECFPIGRVYVKPDGHFSCDYNEALHRFESADKNIKGGGSRTRPTVHIYMNPVEPHKHEFGTDWKCSHCGFLEPSCDDLKARADQLEAQAREYQREVRELREEAERLRLRLASIDAVR